MLLTHICTHLIVSNMRRIFAEVKKIRPDIESVKTLVQSFKGLTSSIGVQPVYNIT